MSTLVTFKKTAIFTLALFGLTALVPLSAHAENPKIAVVNLQYALNTTEQGKQAKSALEREGQDKKQQLTLLENELKKMQEDIQKQKLVLSEAAMKEKMDAFKQKYDDYQKKAFEYEKELKRKEGENVERILSGLRMTVQQLAQQSGYLYVVENSQATLVYIDRSIPDITSAVVAAYNKNPPAVPTPSAETKKKK